ncbi:GntR family transcriptional regulator [Clostridium sp. DL1XJH146]
MIKINVRSSLPIYEQIINGIKENIMKGIILPGDKLPSVREMSTLITANPNTVSKAYKELERQRVIETMRGRGTFVSTSYKPKLEEDKLMVIKNEIKKLIVDAHYMGIEKDDLVKIMVDLYDDIENSSEEKEVDKVDRD